VPGSVLERLKSALPVKPTSKPFKIGLFAGLVTVILKVLVVPFTTSPKATVAGETVIAATPLPLTETVCETPGAATRTLSSPVLVPAVAGLNPRETKQL